MARKSVRKSKQKLGKRRHTPIPTLDQLRAEQTPESGRERRSVEKVAIGRIPSANWLEDFTAAFEYVSSGIALTSRETPHIAYVDADQFAKYQNIKDHEAFASKRQKAEEFISALVSTSLAMGRSASDELSPDFAGLFIKQRRDGEYNIAAEVIDIPTDANQTGFVIRGERLSTASAVMPSARALRQVPEVPGDEAPTHKIWLGSVALGDMTAREFYSEVVPEVTGYLPPAVDLGPVTPAKVSR